jgi:molybdopterin converting factor subunit 1
MRVTVRLFARLRDIAGSSELERDVPAGSTAGRVWDQLVGEFPGLDAYATSISVAVNADYARMDARLAEHDEVAFLPPVSGG